jgi:hypothetical protein
METVSLEGPLRGCWSQAVQESDSEQVGHLAEHRWPALIGKITSTSSLIQAGGGLGAPIGYMQVLLAAPTVCKAAAAAIMGSTTRLPAAGDLRLHLERLHRTCRANLVRRQLGKTPSPGAVPPTRGHASLPAAADTAALVKYQPADQQMHIVLLFSISKSHCLLRHAILPANSFGTSKTDRKLTCQDRT